MRKFQQIAVVVTLALALASVAAAAPSGAFSERGLAAYGATLKAEAAAYRSPAITPAGLRAYGKTLQAEARAYRTADAMRAPSSSSGFSWRDAGLGAGVALAGALLVAGLLAARTRRGLVPVSK